MMNIKDILGGLVGIFRWSRTIFGFVIGVLFLLGLFAYLIIKVIIGKDSLTYLVPIILNFTAIIASLILLIIISILIFRPEKLMLGEVSAEVFMKFMKLRQGDSDRGEYIESIAIEPSSVKALPQETCGKDEQVNDQIER